MGPDIVIMWAIVVLVYLVIGTLISEYWDSVDLTRIGKVYMTVGWLPMAVLLVMFGNI